MSLKDILKKYSKDSSHVVCVGVFDCPVGKLIAAADNEFLYIVSFEDSKNIEKPFVALSNEMTCTFKEQNNDILKKFETQLKDYFDGKLKNFKVPIKTIGSDFQKEVWHQLLELPYASTKTYGDLAKAMGRPASHARAVGAACGANAHLLVIPCHRLVASNSKGGFSCGLDRKEWLLDHEKKYA